jgi:AcrR family transcriptional regulator
MAELRAESVDTRDRILAAAAQVFSRKGYLAASVDEVARAAGMTKGAVYWHFRSKSDLFFALLDYKYEQNITPVPDELRAAAAAAMTSDPRDALTFFLQTVFTRIRADEDWPRLYLEFIGQARDDDMRARLAHFHEQSKEHVAGYIRIMQAAGLAPANRDALLLATFWNALFDGLMLAWIINPSRDQDDLIARIVTLLWDGMAPAAAAPLTGKTP